MAKKIPVIAFANQKGGPGKTTLALQTAFYLSLKGGLKKPILVVDFDAQGNTSTRLMGRSDLEELGGTRTIDLFNEELKEVKPIQSPYGCDLIYSLMNDVELDDIDSEDLRVILNPAKNLQPLLDEGKYSAVIIDCPPSLGRKLYGALAWATHVIVPVEVSGFAVDGIKGLTRTIDRVQEINPDVVLSGIVINKYSSRSDRHRREVKRLEDALGKLVLSQRVAFRTSLDEANSDGVPVWTLNKGSARVAAKEMRAVILEVCRRVGIKK